MKDCTAMACGLTIGLDLGDKYSTLHVLSSEGELQEEGRVRTTQETLKARFSSFPASRVAIEVGTHSPWVSRLLKDCGHEVLVANPRRLRLIYENDRKDDKVDAQYLARVARLDPKLLAPIEHRRLETQKHLTMIRVRDALVRTRSKLINVVRCSVKSVGGRLRGANPDNFHRKVLDDLPEEVRKELSPVIDAIQCLNTKIAECNKMVEEVSELKYPETLRLRQPKGVGPLTALAFVLILEDPRRFKKSRDVGAYLGLVPRKNQSGDQDPQLGITKAGDTLLRRLLVNCAQYIMGPFGEASDLRSHGEKIAAHGGKNAKKRAVVAVARKLSVVLHRLWLSGEDYEPLRNTRKRQTRLKGKMVTSRK